MATRYILAGLALAFLIGGAARMIRRASLGLAGLYERDAATGDLVIERGERVAAERRDDLVDRAVEVPGGVERDRRRVEHDLGDALPVPEVDEDDTAMVAAVRHPAAERDLGALVAHPEGAGVAAGALTTFMAQRILLEFRSLISVARVNCGAFVT